MNDIKYGKLVDLVHSLIYNSYYQKNNLHMIDATMGNGGDTLFLSDLAGKTGNVYSFDIQEIAIENTQRLLEENSKYQNYELILDSHINIDKYIKGVTIDVAVFNLGYLPSSDKHITTNSESTILAIKTILSMLSEVGRVYITAYIGHDDGKEASNVFEFIKSLDKRDYNVINIRLINKDNTPPELYIIERFK